jgi:hypothetical protein
LDKSVNKNEYVVLSSLFPRHDVEPDVVIVSDDNIHRLRVEVEVGV